MAEPLIEPEVAVMVVVPVALLVARPVVGAESLMVATLSAEEVQCAEAVRSCVVPSLRVPVAVNCCVVPNAIDGLAGETEIETRLAKLTVSVVEPATVPEVAVTSAVPVARLVASPVALTVATPVFEDVQVAEPVRSLVVPSV